LFVACGVVVIRGGSGGDEGEVGIRHQRF
jgi:hypothetical protein